MLIELDGVFDHTVTSTVFSALEIKPAFDVVIVKVVRYDGWIRVFLVIRVNV
jgi:hypothetical protein